MSAVCVSAVGPMFRVLGLLLAAVRRHRLHAHACTHATVAVVEVLLKLSGAVSGVHTALEIGAWASVLQAEGQLQQGAGAGSGACVGGVALCEPLAAGVDVAAGAAARLSFR